MLVGNLQILILNIQQNNSLQIQKNKINPQIIVRLIKKQMWERMMNINPVKLKGTKTKQQLGSSNSRIQNKKIGHFLSLQKQNEKPLSLAERSPFPKSSRQKRVQCTVDTQCQQPSQPYITQYCQTQPQIGLDIFTSSKLHQEGGYRSGRVLYCYSKHESPQWMGKAIQYKNQLQTYKTKLYTAQYQLENAQNQSQIILECEKMKYEKRIEEMKRKLAERDQEIRDKDQLIKKFIGITRGLQ